MMHSIRCKLDEWSLITGSSDALPEARKRELSTLICRRSLPTPTDRLWGVKAVQPRLVPNGVPQSYPDTKIPILENPQLFEKLETEALFYAFYYQPGTYQQYLAARELKRQSWRYHKQHRAWFQVIAQCHNLMPLDNVRQYVLRMSDEE